MDQKYRIQNVENIPSPALVVYLPLVQPHVSSCPSDLRIAMKTLVVGNRSSLLQNMTVLLIG